MICHKCGFYFSVEPREGDASPRVISKEKPSSPSWPAPIPSCSPGASAVHSGRLWRWSKEAERMLECGGLPCKHTWLPLTEKCRNKGAPTFCFFLLLFQSSIQSLTLLLSAPGSWRTLNALAVKWGQVVHLHLLASRRATITVLITD